MNVEVNDAGLIQEISGFLNSSVSAEAAGITWGLLLVFLVAAYMVTREM